MADVASPLRFCPSPKGYIGVPRRHPQPPPFRRGSSMYIGLGTVVLIVVIVLVVMMLRGS
jgi:hypothetical protein